MYTRIYANVLLILLVLLATTGGGIISCGGHGGSVPSVTFGDSASGGTALDYELIPATVAHSRSSRLETMRSATRVKAPSWRSA